MIICKNKKNTTQSRFVAGFLLIILVSSFLFNSPAQAAGENYNKIDGSLLPPAEWNNLVNDFVKTWSTATMAGPLGIGTASPAAAFDVFGKIKINSTGTIYNVDSNRYLDMTGIMPESLKVSGNLYSTAGALKIDGTGNSYIMGNLGIGTTVPGVKLNVSGVSNFSDTINIAAGKNILFGNSGPGGTPGGFTWNLTNDGASMYASEVSPDITDYVFKMRDNVTGDKFVWWFDDWQGDAYDVYPMVLAGNYGNFYNGKIYINNLSGHVGIGTASPISTLDVNGLIKMRNYTISQPEDVVNKSYLDSSLASSTASIITQVATSSLWQGSLTGNIYSNNVGNVGIGTVNPGPYKLNVNGNVYIAATSDASIDLVKTGQASSQIKTTGSNGGLVIKSQSSVSNYRPINFITSDGTTDTSRLFIHGDGNIGIGTTTPSKLLTINGFDTAGSLASGVTLLLQSNASATANKGGSVLFGDNSNAGRAMIKGMYTGPGSGGSLAFSTANSSAQLTEAMKIDAAGNIGIGTTAPSYRLDVLSPNTIDAFVRSQRQDTTTPVGFTMANGATNVSYMYMPPSSSDIRFYTGGDRLSILNSNGNVGIGTTIPSVSLHVNNNTGLRISRASNPDQYMTLLGGDGSGVASITSFYNLKFMGGASPTYGYFQFSNSSGDLMRITQTGSVGIGTTAPSAKLDVLGSFRVSGALNSVVLDRLSGTGNRIVMTDSSGSLYATSSDIASGLPAAGALGSTLYSNGSKWTATTNLYSNGTNVGIGTTTALDKLHVVGNIRHTGSIISQGANYSSAWMNFDQDINGNSLILGAGALTVLGSGESASIIRANISATQETLVLSSDNDIRFITNAQSGWASTTAAMTILNAGNVGIGTTAPSYRLDVLSPNTIDAFVRSQRQDTTTPVGFTMANGATNVSYMYMPPSSSDIRFYTGGDRLSILNSNGNVGIGTTNPGVKLEVASGTAKFLFDPATALISAPASTDIKLQANSQNIFRGLDGWSDTWSDAAITTYFQTGRASGNTAFSAYSGSPYNRLAFISSKTQFINNGSAVTPPVNYFQVDYNNSNLFSIQSGGNVGIGTTAPSAKLDVLGSFRVSGALNSVVLDRLSGTGNRIVMTDSSGSLYATSSDIASGLPAAGALGSTLYSNGSKWTATTNLYSNGTSVGIGTTSPLYKLDIVGPINVTNGYSEPTAEIGYRIKFADNGGINNDSGIGLSGSLTNENLWINKGSANGSIRFMFGTSGEKVTFTSAGNVGIGTTAPSYRLDVLSPNTIDAFVRSQRQDTTTPVGFTMANGATNVSYMYMPPSSSDIRFYTGGDRLSILNSNGNVGIGTTNPANALDVVGRGSFSNGIVLTGVPTSSSDINYIQASNSASTVGFLAGSGVFSASSGPYFGARGNTYTAISGQRGQMFFSAGAVNTPTGNEGTITFSTTPGSGTNEAIRMIINRNGNVGIGTTAPSAKLDVLGSFRVSGALNSVVLDRLSGTGNRIVMTDSSGSLYATSSDIASGLPTAGALGSTLYSNGSKWTATTNLYSNGTNVGIGTNNPSAKLDIESSSTSSPATLAIGIPGGTAATIGTLKFQRSSADIAWAGIVGFSTFTDQNGLAFYTTPGGSVAATERMRIAQGGNIGIGTTAPSYRLDVLSPNTIDAFVRSQRQDTTTPVGFTMANGTTNVSYMYMPPSSSDIRFYTGGDRLSILNSNGNVGIGTTAPSTKLEVKGNYGGQLTLLKLWNEGAGSDNTGVDLDFASTVGGSVTGKISNIRRPGNDWDTAFQTSDNGVLAEKMRITGDGKVGIGTTNPAGTLEIKNSIDNSSNWPVWVKSNAYATSSITGIRIQNGGASEYNDFKSVGIAAVADSIASNLTGMGLYVGNSQMLHISSSGSVGIGSTAPAYKLDVAGTAQFNNAVIVGTPTASNHATTKSYVDSIASASAGGGVGSGTTGQTLRHNGTSWIANSTLYNNGTNVGIGTINPSTKLHVANTVDGVFNGLAIDNRKTYGAGTGVNETSRLILSLTESGITDPLLRVFGYVESGVSNELSSADGWLAFGSRVGGVATEKMRINNIGNVGIGTTAPASKLDIAESGDSNKLGMLRVFNPGAVTPGRYTSLMVGNSAANGGNIALGFVNDTTTPANSFGYLANHGNNELTSSLVIRYGGNIGIGTSIPSYKLDVAGTAQFNNAVIVGTPTAINHATTKSYVDSAIAGVGGGIGTGTSGQTLRHNGTSWIANSTLYNNGTNVGINNTSPSAMLSVGSGSAGLHVIPGSATNGYKTAIGFNTYWNGSSWATIGDGGSNGGSVITSNWGDGSINFSSFSNTGGTSKTVSLNNLMSILPSGNVGIGTTAPSYRLDVLSPNTIDAFVRSQRQDTTTPVGFTMANGTTNVSYMYMPPSSSDIRFYTGGDRLSILNSNGNVGIGTTAPNQQLEITKNFRLPSTTGTTPYGIIYKDGNRFIHDFNYGNNGTVTTSGGNTFIGLNAGNFTMGSTATLNYQASYNTVVGNNAFYSNTLGAFNTISGQYAAHSNTTGTNNSTYGYNSLGDNTSGGNNTAIGANSLVSNITGNNAVAIGSESQRYANNTTTPFTNTNTSVGFQALRGGTDASLNTGNGNSAFGFQTLLANTSGGYNTANGYASLYSNTSGNNNTALGYYSLFYNNTGSNNVAIGYNSLRANTAGNNNIALGLNALYNTTASSNTAIGYSSLFSNTSGGSNTALGFYAGYYLANGTTGRTTGNNGLYLGTHTKASTDGTDNETVIGYNAIGAGTNSVVLGNDSVTKTILKGTVSVGTPINPEHAATKSYVDSAAMSAANSFWTANGANIYNSNSGSVGIGTTTPISKLTVVSGSMGSPYSAINALSGAVGNYTSISVGRTSPDVWLGVSGASNNFLTGTVAGDSVLIHSGKLYFGSAVNGSPQLVFDNSGNVGIGTISPAAKLDIWGSLKSDSGNLSTDGLANITAESFSDRTNVLYKLDPSNTGTSLNVAGGIAAAGAGNSYIMGNLGLGTTNPSPYKLYVNGSAYISGSLTFAASSTLSIPGGNLTVNKLTVNTIDPLYNIKGVNYSTFAPSIVGGVKEEVTGKLKISKKAASEYQTVIDFSKETIGSDLWVWYNVIDFSEANVEAFITPYGSFANVYYTVSGNQIIFHADRPTEISYRLLAKRHDWREWPTKAHDQQEKAGFIIK